jgi:glycosyltransferase involved in cell wall biosynthesis
MNKSDIIVVIPTYNNHQTIKTVIEDILTNGYKIIVVDDGSEPKIEYQDKDVIICRHKKNQGKGGAIITGARQAKALGYEYFVSFDGDGQHLSSEIELLLKACDGKNQIVIGARDFDIANVPNGSKFGRWFSNMWACWDTGSEIKDSLSGFRLYPLSILDLRIASKKFAWEMEVLVKHAWKGYGIKEQTVRCYYPKPEERVSHFKKFRDTMAIVWVHIRLLPLKPILKKLKRYR